jgi:hypothetical protein
MHCFCALLLWNQVPETMSGEGTFYNITISVALWPTASIILPHNNVPLWTTVLFSAAYFCGTFCLRRHCALQVALPPGAVLASTPLPHAREQNIMDTSGVDQQKVLKSHLDLTQVSPSRFAAIMTYTTRHNRVPLILYFSILLHSFYT